MELHKLSAQTSVKHKLQCQTPYASGEVVRFATVEYEEQNTLELHVRDFFGCRYGY